MCEKLLTGCYVTNGRLKEQLYKFLYQGNGNMTKSTRVIELGGQTSDKETPHNGAGNVPQLPQPIHKILEVP